jgi:acyl-CoA synthetase (AMP-forming)/AMP-acid ligase II
LGEHWHDPGDGRVGWRTAGGGHPERSASAAELLNLAYAAAERFREYPAVLYLGANHLAYPIALFSAAQAGVPFIPLNYRLGEQQLAALLARHPGALVLRQADLDGLLVSGAYPVGSIVPTPEPASASAPASAGGDVAAEPRPADDDDPVAVVLYTSGTAAVPKAALLRHRHLLAYVLNTVDFASAEDGDAALVSVPPYHVAGLANLLTNLYAGRRLVYLPFFDAANWLATVRRERVTHARLFPKTGFVNAYGLTETTSSIAVLSPEDHRAALTSSDAVVRDRLGSVGRALPGVEFQIRDSDGACAGPGETGLIFVRGDQISGEYGGHSALDADGWFPTRDRG